MPWDKPDWVDGFRSLSFLVGFQLRSWYHLKEADDTEIVMQWVNNAPVRLRYVMVLSGVRQNEGRRVVWHNGKLSVQEPIGDYGIAFV
jgi:hypothetical protein